MNNAQHPLSGYPEEEIIDYLSVVAFIASADNDVTDAEVSKLRELCKAVGLGGIGIGKVIAAAEDPTSVNIEEIISRLSESKLKFTLLTDMFFMAFADNIFAPSEEEEIKKVAAKLNINEEQLAAIQKYVKTLIDFQDFGDTEGDLKDLGAEVVAGLASTGVPIAAVAVSGSVFGLSAAGITSGLAALGLGLGMTTGIGVVAALGIGSYLGVRYLYKKLSGSKKDE